jgi:LssY C-terminus
LRPKTAVFLFPWLAVCFCLSCIQIISACDQVPAGQTFRIRLLQPVSSYSSKPGSLVRGILIESPQCDGMPMFPDGTLVEGHVKSVHKVGMGFRHEIAELQIEFGRIRPRGAPPIEIRARVLEVDNAREKVKNGVINGIRSTNTPQDHISSRVQYLATWDPDCIWILPVYRALFPVLPEPELYFPPGTDFLLEFNAPLRVAKLDFSVPAKREFDQSAEADLDDQVLSFPERTTTPKGQAADVVNLAFIGSQEQLEDAFEAAGWDRSEAMSRREALREIHAFLMLTNNPHGPVSEQLLQGQPSDSAWEKGFDSIAKRDHLRIWRAPDTWQGKPVWLSASTQEIGASLSLRRREFVHYVDPNIDEERGRVVRDLALAGCVGDTRIVARPSMAHSVVNATGGEMQTDGAIAVVELKDCDHPVFQDGLPVPKSAFRPRSRFARYVRTQVLSFHDLWRENIVYGAFDLTRQLIRTTRRNYSHAQTRGQDEIPGPLSTGIAPGSPTTLDSQSMP